jgi:protein-L-isoaspartate O-methyltransferase
MRSNSALTESAQVRMSGNPVDPPVAHALIQANFAHEREFAAAEAGAGTGLSAAVISNAASETTKANTEMITARCADLAWSANTAVWSFISASCNSLAELLDLAVSSKMASASVLPQ